jgi:hypothetical protein
MPIEFHIVESEEPTRKLKLAIVGEEKTGKSRLASTGRKNILFHDFDNRAESLQGQKGVYVISYVERQWPNQPDAAQKFLDVLGRLEASLDIHDLRDIIPAADSVPKGTIVRCNVIDSIYTMGKAFNQFAIFGSKDIRREIKFSGYTVLLGSGWDAWNSEMIPVENNILRLLALPCDTVITMHEAMEETDDSSSDKKKFTGKIGVYPARYQRLIKYFNEVWRMEQTQVVDPKTNKSTYFPRVYPLPNYKFNAASTMLLDAVEEPNIEAMLLKHERELAKRGLLPAPPQAKVLPIGITTQTKT